jgi:hypothetical protein
MPGCGHAQAAGAWRTRIRPRTHNSGLLRVAECPLLSSIATLCGRSKSVAKGHNRTHAAFRYGSSPRQRSTSTVTWDNGSRSNDVCASAIGDLLSPALHASMSLDVCLSNDLCPFDIFALEQGGSLGRRITYRLKAKGRHFLLDVG